MTQLADIDWNIVQALYEVHGHSLEALQDRFGVSEKLMAYQARNWRPYACADRKPLRFSQSRDIKKVTADVLADIKDEADLLHLVKQKDLVYDMVEIERILLRKTMLIAAALPEEEQSIQRIRNLIGVLRELYRFNPIVNPIPKEDSEAETSADGNRVEVVIIDPNENSNTKKTRTVSDQKETV